MDYQHQICKVLTPLEIMVGKWKPIILLHLLRSGTKRFSELQKLIPEITKRMLTLHLRELEEQDIVSRVVYPEVPPRVEYSITEHGRTLVPILESMNDWGIGHLEYIKDKNIHINVLEGYEDVCRVLTALQTIVGKWKPIILLHLILSGTKRFSELQKLMPEITKRMLTLQLRELEEEGIIKRVVYSQVPPKVEYSITDYGETLEPILGEMHEWGNAHLDYISNKKPKHEK